jgi:predicted RND superfamily exporter protein
LWSGNSMWVKISNLIIKNRILLLGLTILITIFMAYKSREVEMTYDFVKVVPENDSSMLEFKKFKSTFGEDGNILVIGFKDVSVYKLKNFLAFQKLTNSLSGVEGINGVVSLPTVKRLTKDTVENRFVQKLVFEKAPATQKELDSLLKKASEVKFYEGLLVNKKTRATLIAVAMERSFLNSSRRTEVVDNIVKHCEIFSGETGIKLHYAGLPYVRAIMIGKVQKEFKLFLILAVVITSVILFMFFRSFAAVFFTFLVIVVTVFWTMGTLVLFGYKITLLTGILPALIIVIGIPNCIYMFNKYHQEFRRHGNKLKAVSRIIEKIGFLTFMTNANTAVGFFVLYFTDISVIKEFGMVAGIISLATFLITIVVIPSLLIYLPAPNAKQLKHLDLNFLRKVNFALEHIVLRYRPYIYGITIIAVSIGIYGISRIQAVSYMVDDLPENSNVKSDLVFFEKNFEGVMPLEFIVDLGKKKAVLKLSNLKKLEELETYLKSVSYVSPPLSILNIVKGSRQAFYNEDPEYYSLPTNNTEMSFIAKYYGKGKENDGLVRSFVDSTGQQVRFTCKVADIGTNKMNELVEHEIRPHINEIFKGTGFNVKITGTTLLFLKGNKYLIDDLTGSLFFAFILISLMMAMIFTNVRIILISLVPNIIPMLITAGIMGLFNIPLKPSTALIFSISFGISIDSTIHYLSKYKQDLALYKDNVLQAVTHSLEEAGVSMIYTSIVLFFGFVIFAWSDFGGTVALGLLTSITLFVAMFTNLLILPALLLTFGKGNKHNLYAILDVKERFYEETDDEEIDVRKIEVGANTKTESESEI